MVTTAPRLISQSNRVKTHVDVLIVGAGVSGIGAAVNIRKTFPSKSFMIVDAMEGPGGTWQLHKYPGVRSDSDLFTYGYSFKPWTGPAIASGEEILNYLDDVVQEYDLHESIHYGQRVTAATWSTEQNLWTVEISNVATGESRTVTTNFLWMCPGYYKYDQGYTPQWPGMENYQGRIVHPQRWPEDLDYADKRVIIIGSGATAATLIPTMAGDVEHLTMVQRTPSFFSVKPKVHEMTQTLRDLEISDDWIHEIMRRFYIKQTAETVRMTFEHPDTLREFLLGPVREALPEGFDIDKHFTPPYRALQQRTAATLDGDLFDAIRSGNVSIVTDTIETFTQKGLRVSSGEEVEADLIVTATGFNMSLFGGVEFTVDGESIDINERLTYRGMMIEGIPNMAYMLGYFRSSYTLRVDLISDVVCRILAHMENKGVGSVRPELRPEDADIERLPFANPENWNAGYVLRASDELHQRSENVVWTNWNEYEQERELFPSLDLEDGLVYQ